MSTELDNLSRANGFLQKARNEDDAGAAREAAKILLAEDAGLRDWLTREGAKKTGTISTDRIVEAAYLRRLYRGDDGGAATILWGEDLFTIRPHSVQLIWQAADVHPLISIMGSSAQGKSYSAAVKFFLRWLAAPERTIVDLVSTNEEALKNRLFSVFYNLHSHAAIQLPGHIDTESISLDKKSGYGIFTNLLNRGVESTGKIKGKHLKQTADIHPVYARRSFRYLLIDEAQDVADNVFSDLGNVRASMPIETPEVIRQRGNRPLIQIILTANPKNPNSKYGQMCKPKDGWASISEDSEEWQGGSGAHVISLDALKSENYLTKKTVFPGFQTFQGVEDQLKMCGGDESHPDWWTFVRGKFPKEGVYHSLIPMRWITAQEGDWIFSGDVQHFAGLDCASFGADSPALTLGKAGLAHAFITYAGQVITLPFPRYAAQADACVRLSAGDTQEVANDAMSRIRPYGIPPENVAVDLTGSRGVFDLMRRQWKSKNMTESKLVKEQLIEMVGLGSVRDRLDDKGDDGEEVAPILGVHYSEKATPGKITAEQSEPNDKLYSAMHSELWYGTAKYFELGIVRYGRGVGDKVLEQLSTKRGGKPASKGRKMTAEPKEAHKRLLNGKSPDEADSFNLMLFAARMILPQLTPKHDGTPATPAAHPRSTELPQGAFELSGYDGPTLPETEDRIEPIPEGVFE